jgi:hypothetical protein
MFQFSFAQDSKNCPPKSRKQKSTSKLSKPSATDEASTKKSKSRVEYKEKSDAADQSREGTFKSEGEVKAPKSDEQLQGVTGNMNEQELNCKCTPKSKGMQDESKMDKSKSRTEEEYQPGSDLNYGVDTSSSNYSADTSARLEDERYSQPDTSARLDKSNEPVILFLIPDSDVNGEKNNTESASASSNANEEVLLVKEEKDRDGSHIGNIIEAPFKGAFSVVSEVGEGVGHIAGAPFKGIAKMFGRDERDNK